MAEEETISEQLAQAIKTTLQMHLIGYASGPETKDLTYHFVEEEIDSAKYPQVLIRDSGSQMLVETMHGQNLGGVTEPGWAIQTYGFDLQVFLKGGLREETRAPMNRVRDGIKACLEVQHTLGEIAAEIQVKADEPTMTFSEESAWTRVGIVRAAVTSWSLQGATQLLGS